MRTLYARLSTCGEPSKLNDCEVVLSENMPEFVDGRWRTGKGIALGIVTGTVFRLLFGCSEVPTQSECWEFSAGGFEHRCWLRMKIHRPPAPQPERTYTLEEIEKAYSTSPAWYDCALRHLKERLEALPRKEDA